MGTHSLDKIILQAIEERGSIETFEFAKEVGKDHQSVVGSVKSIHALGDVSMKTALTCRTSSDQVPVMSMC